MNDVPTYRGPYDEGRRSETVHPFLSDPEFLVYFGNLILNCTSGRLPKTNLDFDHYKTDIVESE